MKDFMIFYLPSVLWICVAGLGLRFMTRGFRVLALGRLDAVRRITQKWSLDAAGVAPMLGMVWTMNGLFLLGAAVVMAAQSWALSQWGPWVLGVQLGFFVLNEAVLQWHMRRSRRRSF